eukprot:scaffold1461_cov253-Pinguiococcus_pyrenoidosus.AAC.15
MPRSSLRSRGGGRLLNHAQGTPRGLGYHWNLGLGGRGDVHEDAAVQGSQRGYVGSMINRLLPLLLRAGRAGPGAENDHQ